jgi:hypothetical protein
VPRPEENDPLKCSGKLADLTEHDSGWLTCGVCTRTLKTSGAHRVRSKNTRSLDNTRDGLLAAGIGPA